MTNLEKSHDPADLMLPMKLVLGIIQILKTFNLHQVFLNHQQSCVTRFHFFNGSVVTFEQIEIIKNKQANKKHKSYSCIFHKIHYASSLQHGETVPFHLAEITAARMQSLMRKQKYLPCIHFAI